MDCEGGSSGGPSSNSSRVNQRASSSSPLDAHGDPGSARGVKAEHQRGGERPGLRGVVVARRDAHARFLEHFARHRVFEALARLDESRDGGIAARRPARLPAEQRALAVRHQHDDGGIDARKGLVRRTSCSA